MFTQDLHQWKVSFLSCLIRHIETSVAKNKKKERKKEMAAPLWRKHTRTGRLGWRVQMRVLTVSQLMS